MKIFKKIIDILNSWKYIDIWGDRNEGLSDDDIKYMDSIPSQNPYGVVGMIISGFAFLFPQYPFFVITLTFCIVTFFTFDKEKEDNPWTFIMGIILSLVGLLMFIKGEVHHLII